jgi:hypothetical protein
MHFVVLQSLRRASDASAANAAVANAVAAMNALTLTDTVSACDLLEALCVAMRSAPHKPDLWMEDLPSMEQSAREWRAKLGSLPSGVRFVATCRGCGQRMDPGGSCDAGTVFDRAGLARSLRLALTEIMEVCRDCNVGDGGYHHTECSHSL